MNIKELVESLSIDEKIRLLNGVGSWYTYSADGKLPVYKMSDGPHGLRVQDNVEYADINDSHIATCFPTASCLASSWNKESARKTGEAIADEAIAEQVHIVLGPGLNVKRSPLCGRNFEYFSEDPYLSGVMSSYYVKGMQEKGVNACIKHFVANNQERKRQTSNSIIDERTLNEIYLSGFEYAIKNGKPGTIMCSYNRLNGPFASQSKKLLTEVLRNKWNYKGAVISDWGAAINMSKCVSAGLDLAMPDSFGYLTKHLKEDFEKGLITEAEINLACERILNIPHNIPSQKPVDYKVQHEKAIEIAEDSAVLLKNNGLLPLSPQKICVIGEFAENMKFQGGGSSHITTAEYPNAIETLNSFGFDILYSKGFTTELVSKKIKSALNKDLKNEAIALCKQAKEENLPVLLFVGLTEEYEGEGFDRPDMLLPPEQLELINEVTNITDNIVVVSFSGSPIDFAFEDKVNSILHMYLCGEGCSQAIADLLTGKANPSGKLAETFPMSEKDTPCYNNFGSNELNIEYKERMFVGYRHYDSKNIPVRFEFGFGLSYTTFEYSDLKVSQSGNIVNVEVTVKNTGKVPGAEVVQLYVKNPDLGFERVNKDLREFDKVYLQPQESKTISFELNDRDFSVYSTSKNEFVPVTGNYEIQIGASSKNIKLSKEIAIQGESHENLFVEEDLSKYYVEPHKKGNFDISDCLEDMAKKSMFVRHALYLFNIIIYHMNKGRSREDPAVKIAVKGFNENPLESLISTSGGELSEKMAKFLLRKANK